MGDRAAVSIKQGYGENVCLYTHWGGSELPATLRRAVISILGGEDNEITNAAVVAAVTAAAMGEETIVGLASTLSSIEYPLLVVDPRTQMITVRNTAYAEQRARICHHLVPGVDLLIVGNVQQSHTTYDPALRAAELKKTVECPEHCDISVVGNLDDRIYTFEEFTDLPEDIDWGSLGEPWAMQLGPEEKAKANSSEVNALHAALKAGDIDRAEHYCKCCDLVFGGEQEGEDCDECKRRVELRALETEDL
jgi:hypothetical protein